MFTATQKAKLRWYSVLKCPIFIGYRGTDMAHIFLQISLSFVRNSEFAGREDEAEDNFTRYMKAYIYFGHVSFLSFKVGAWHGKYSDAIIISSDRSRSPRWCRSWSSSLEKQKDITLGAPL